MGSATKAANRQFLYLFEVIYCPRFWSLRRLRRSCVSSSLAVLIVGLALGATPDVVAAEFSADPSYWFGMAVGNLLADYLSLQETEWIMRRSHKSSRILHLIPWALLDLILTLIIYLATVISTLAMVDLFGPAVGAWETTAYDTVMWAFVLSTFATSALWFSFIAVAIAIRVLRVSSPLLRAALQAIGESSHPARTIAGLIQIPIVVVFVATLLLGGTS